MKKLPESELDIMMTVWQITDEHTSGVCADEIIENLEKNWTKTTVLNFLSRLCTRGFLSCRKDGRINLYTPLVDKDAYLKNESRSFLAKLHKNSLTSLVASLYDGKSITKNDLEELKKYIEDAE